MFKVASICHWRIYHQYTQENAWRNCHIAKSYDKPVIMPTRDAKVIIVSRIQENFHQPQNLKGSLDEWLLQKLTNASKLYLYLYLYLCRSNIETSVDLTFDLWRTFQQIAALSEPELPTSLLVCSEQNDQSCSMFPHELLFVWQYNCWLLLNLWLRLLCGPFEAIKLALKKRHLNWPVCTWKSGNFYFILWHLRESGALYRR